MKQSTLGRGVHFMMADGGFSVEGQENIQEILSKQLYLGQFTVALGIVREGQAETNFFYYYYYYYFLFIFFNFFFIFFLRDFIFKKTLFEKLQY